MHNEISHIIDSYKELQNIICNIIENTDGKGVFEKFFWNKDIGSGITMVLQKGDIVEKGAVNFSRVSGNFSAGLEKALGIKGKSYSATGVSSIIHPNNPWVPIIHMNVRYFEIDNGTFWFGGGIDLTPHYIIPEDAKKFHTALKDVCDGYSSEFYPKFKPWADDYFYLKHRQETRGIGGIFFDRINPENYGLSNEEMLKYTLDLGKLYPKIYSQFIMKHRNTKYNESHKTWQNIRRSRYVEFNLLHDRGTKFGLESGGNIESILLSMPPVASWEYNFTPRKDSLEADTVSHLKKNINWLNHQA